MNRVLKTSTGKSVTRIHKRTLTTSANIPKPPKQGVPYRQVLSGIQPTGCIHIGNYFGALENWTTMQSSERLHHYRNVLKNIQEKRNYLKTYGAELNGSYQPVLPNLVAPKVLYTIVDLHAITVPQVPKDLHASCQQLAATLLALGVDPAKASLFYQSHVKGHSELMWLLACNTPLSRLYRMTQFKDKAQKLASTASAEVVANEEPGDDQLLRGVDSGLLMYPVLMAADILLYNATHVPVGADQTQHIELTREIARIMNHRYGKKSSPIFIEPACVYNTEGSRVMSLKDGTKKMSKSDVIETSRISLIDTDAQIRNKIKGAQTDALGGVSYDIKARPGVSNLVDICLATENAGRRRQFLQDIDSKLQNTYFGKHDIFNNPEALHTLAFSTIEDNDVFTQYCNEYLSIVDDFESGMTGLKHDDIVSEFSTSKLSTFKEYIGDKLVSELAPIREKTKEYLSQKQALQDILAEGAQHANMKGKHTLDKVHSSMGYVLP